MAFKSALMRNFWLRSPTIKLGSCEGGSQSRGTPLTDISSANLREGVRFGRWLLGRTGEGRKTSSDLVLQCHSVAALRVRRIVKILQLYKEIYSEHTVSQLVQSFSASFKNILNGRAVLGVRSSSGTLLSACLFHWNEENISEADLRICIDDLKQLEKIKTGLEGPDGGGGGEKGGKDETNLNAGDAQSHMANGNGNHGNSHNSNCSSLNGNNSADNRLTANGVDSQAVASSSGEASLEGWEPVMDKPQMKAWRRPIFDGQLFQYKIYGTWEDVPAAAFYLIQVDLDYRKAWDKLVVKLDVIDRDDSSGAEVVHWVTHFPFPMSQRDYVYTRRFMVDHDKNIAVLMSKGVEHPKEPVIRKYVRVHRYMSNMVIKPHTSFEDAGLDYVLTYYDDPQATIPSVAMSWMATTGVPKFTEELRSATLNLIKDKGMPVVKEMFQRRISDQPLATLKDPEVQSSIEEEEKAIAEQEVAEKWSAFFDISNNNDESEITLQPLAAEEASEIVLQPFAAGDAADQEVEQDPSKGEAGLEDMPQSKHLREKCPLPVEESSLPFLPDTEEYAGQKDVVLDRDSPANPEASELSVLGDLFIRPLPLGGAVQQNFNQNNNNNSDDNDDNDSSRDVGGAIPSQTITEKSAGFTALVLRDENDEGLRLNDDEKELPLVARDSRRGGAAVVTRDIEKALAALLRNYDKRRPTLRDLVLELSSSSSPVFALQGKDYPGMHANNPSYLVSRTSSLFCGVDAFCLVK